ncbi:TPA: hypothetical protein KDY05_002047 [Vibrio parahaemolyticus]|nr:hypothetical protein [Vibrio parahaemolyticus]
MIVNKTIGKFETNHFSLNTLDDSLFEVFETAEHEDSSYTLTKSVAVKITEDQLPKNFFTTHRYSHNKVEGTEVSYGVNIDSRRGLSIDINFAYSLHISRRRSEKGQQLIRDTVTTEFNKVNFLQAAKDALTGIMERNIQELNREEEQQVHRFFENNAAKSAENLLIESDCQEWKFLKEQEEQLTATLAKLKDRQAVLRKEALKKSLKEDEREFPENIQKLFDDYLMNVPGIKQRRMFSY